MTKEEILEKAKKIDGLGGITFNERLYVAGLMDTFDKAKRKDKELARFILETIRLNNQSIDKKLG
jgi:hypothetical protein